MDNNTKQKNQTATDEWMQSKRWNPFNSYKLLTHVERWKNIVRGQPIPAPALVTIDPTNKCNLGCVWCNAARIRSERGFSLSGKALKNIADFLPVWGRTKYPAFGVDAICIAGGGEPLLNPNTPDFIENIVANGIEAGMVTNGTLIDRGEKALSQCTWLGVSVDAGGKDVFNRLKGLPPESQTFTKIIENIANLVDYCRSHECRLGKSHPSYGVSFKYLLYGDNIGEVFTAAKLAKEIGCKNIHFRPAGTTWDNLDSENEILFSPDELSLFKEEIRKAFELDDEQFGVYGVTHKFTGQFKRENCFQKCHSSFMTAVFGPPSSQDSPQDAFVMGVCCDRRGDSKLELLVDEVDVSEIERVWGGEKHWQLHDGVDVQADCPRCTYQPHNQIYENVIQKDSMTYKFI